MISVWWQYIGRQYKYVGAIMNCFGDLLWFPIVVIFVASCQKGFLTRQKCPAHTWALLTSRHSWFWRYPTVQGFQWIGVFLQIFIHSLGAYDACLIEILMDLRPIYLDLMINDITLPSYVYMYILYIHIYIIYIYTSRIHNILHPYIHRLHGWTDQEMRWSCSFGSEGPVHGAEKTFPQV